MKAPIYSVSQLNQQVRQLLEGNFPLLLVEGEISNLKKPASGHLYFSLKDAFAQVRCAMFRLRNQLLPFDVKDGMHVIVQAKISLYEERGDFQLVVQNIEETGAGALRRAFELLKSRLAQEGLFATEHKKSIPTFPRQLGVITSPTGAAIRDILHVLQRRFPSLPIIIYPTLVQGAEAAAQIVAAIHSANERAECDILILARGGGPLEDLWPFNEEVVARAIYASQIPVVSGIGHEIDFTIADFVADQRAPTPSAAAELISPNLQECLQKLQYYQKRIEHFTHVELRHQQQRLLNLHKRLRHPSHQLFEYAQRLDNIERVLIKTELTFLLHRQNNLENILAKIQGLQPKQLVQQFKLQRQTLTNRLESAMTHYLEQWQQKLASSARSLSTVNPLNTLQRGYAIVTQQEKIVTSVTQVTIGDSVTTQIADGQLVCVVKDSQYSTSI